MKSAANSYDCVIVGAGVAGAEAGRAIRSAGFSVCVLEKSRGVGGRLATRRIDGERFDHGAQFLTARKPPLRQRVAEWLGSGVVRPWFGEEERIRYCGTVDMNSVGKDLVGELEVRRQFKVERIEFSNGSWTVYSGDESVTGSRLLLTCPAPQALDILNSSRVEVGTEFPDVLKTIKYDRCISLMLLLQKEVGITSSGILQLDTEEPIATIVETSLKGTTERPGIVIQSGPEFAAANYDASPEDLFHTLTRALPSTPKLDVVDLSVQKWKFAKRRPHALEASFAREEGLSLWHAGDGYLAPRVEGAFESGLKAAASIVNSLQKSAEVGSESTKGGPSGA